MGEDCDSNNVFTCRGCGAELPHPDDR
jgi:hypothetical protein